MNASIPVCSLKGFKPMSPYCVCLLAQEAAYRLVSLLAEECSGLWEDSKNVHACHIYVCIYCACVCDPGVFEYSHCVTECVCVCV